MASGDDATAQANNRLRIFMFVFSSPSELQGEGRCNTSGDGRRRCEARELPREARLRPHRRAEWGGRGLARSPLRHPAARRAPHALRFSARARWRVALVGRAEGPELVAEAPPACRAHGGSPARLRRLRGHHREGRVRGWRRLGLGSRHVAARGRRGGGDADRQAHVHARRREAARSLASRAHQAATQAGGLAVVQGPRRARRRRARHRRGRARERDLGPDNRRVLPRVSQPRDSGRSKRNVVPTPSALSTASVPP